MKLYIVEGQGIWGDADSHPLPSTVEVVPRVDLGVAEINGQSVGISGGKFTINAGIANGPVAIKVNGVPCEQLYCRTFGGNVRRVNAVGQDLRAILPVVSRIEALEKIVQRHEGQLGQKDIFG